MSRKENKKKKKQAKGVTMSELINRGEIGEFDHLKDLIDIKEEQLASKTNPGKK